MAEGNGLLNRRTSNACTAGSNPALSVRFFVCFYNYLIDKELRIF